MLGQLVLAKNVDATETFSGMQAGIYNVIIRQGEEISRQKIVVN